MNPMKGTTEIELLERLIGPAGETKNLDITEVKEPIRLFEGEKNCKLRIRDFSGYGDPEHPRYQGYRGVQYLRDLLFPIMGLDGEAVVFNDVSPTERGTIPTGVVVKFTPHKNNFLDMVGGSDMGCRMVLAHLPVTRSEFMGNKGKEWDLVCELLGNNLMTDLGGGNHFLLGVADGEKMRLLLHTGPTSKEQDVLKALAGKPGAYFRQYEGTIRIAGEKCQNILDVASKLYGRIGPSFTWTHNTISIDQETGQVIIRKGVVEAQSGGYYILPASLGYGVTVFRAGTAVGQDTLHSLPHGTGRRLSRAGAKEEDLTEAYGPLNVHHRVDPRRFFEFEGIPEFLVPSGWKGFPVTELPHCYYTPHESLEIMEGFGLANVVKTLEIVGYAGHIGETREAA